jgi:membrane protease YdiL (CAAX protease family)
MATRGWIAGHDIQLYFVLAFLLSWCIWPLMLLNADSSPLVPFGPAIAALTVVAIVGGKHGLVALLNQLSRWRRRPVWYVIAVAGPFALTSVAAALVVLAGAPAPDWLVYTDLVSLGANLLATMVIVGLFEELGWRGFALPRLQESHSALRAALLLGAIWAVWHLPELVSNPTQREPLPYLVWVVAFSVILAWLYNSTRGSLPLIIIAHAAVNTSVKFLMPQFGREYFWLAWWALAVVFVLTACAVVAFAGSQELTTGGGSRMKLTAEGDFLDKGSLSGQRPGD